MPRTPIHPGEILAEQLAELGLSARESARRLKMLANRITQILRAERAITADSALRFGHYFGTDPRFWLNLQQSYELRMAERAAGRRLSELPRARDFSRPRPGKLAA